MKRIVLAIGVLSVGAVVLVAPSIVAAAPKTAAVTIRHQTKGCHAWSVNGGAFAASQAVTLARGGSIRFTNNDVMPHVLIKLSGPAVHMANAGVMNRMGATTTVSFTRAGTYVFKTKPGEDYMAGVKTVGEDNVLRLTVKVH
jgi:plastocyanin